MTNQCCMWGWRKPFMGHYRLRYWSGGYCPYPCGMGIQVKWVWKIHSEQNN